MIALHPDPSDNGLVGLRVRVCAKAVTGSNHNANRTGALIQTPTRLNSTSSAQELIVMGTGKKSNGADDLSVPEFLLVKNRKKTPCDAHNTQRTRSV